MGLFDFLNSKSNTVDYDKLVSFYEEYVKSCTLQPMIFPQMVGNLDVFESEYVRDKDSYLAQFNRLIDVIRLGELRDPYGRPQGITMGQEFYLRFTLATWILSKLNSYDELGQQIRMSMDEGFRQLVFVVELHMTNSGPWIAEGTVHLFENNYTRQEFNFRDALVIDEEIYNSKDPFKVYTTFNDTPKRLLVTMFNITRMLLFTTKPLIEVKGNLPTRGEIYADFWLKKMVAAIIMSSEEWYMEIENDDNIKEITDIRCTLWDDVSIVKKIQFKFNVKLRNTGKVLNFDYEYTIPTDRFFNTEYIRALVNFVMENHNLDY